MPAIGAHGAAGRKPSLVADRRWLPTLPPMPMAGEIVSWPEGLTAALPEEPWLVVQTRWHHEKRLAANLRYLGVPSLLFLERRVRVYPGKDTQVSMVPLLPGYIFVHGDGSAYERLFSTDRVLRVLPVRRPDVLRLELLDLISLLSFTAVKQLTVRPEIQPGVRVRMLRGALAGLTGVVVRRRGRCNVAVNLHALGHSVLVDCSAEDVAEAVAVPDGLEVPAQEQAAADGPEVRPA